MSESSFSSSEFATEVVKEGILKFRKGSFGRWRRSLFRLTGNGVLSEILGEKKKTKVIDIKIKEAEVSSGESLTGNKLTISILCPKNGHIFLKLSEDEEFNKWFHLIISYSKRNSLNSFELSEDAVIISNIKGTIISANFAAVEIFGYEDKAELLGKPVEILMPISTAKNHVSYMTRYENGGTPRLLGKPREMLGRRKDTSEFPILLSLGELISSEHRNFIATIKDLTRSKISKTKADSIVSKIQSNLKTVIEEQASAYQRIVNDAIESEIHSIVTTSQKVKDELISAEAEVIMLTKKSNQQATILNTFKTLCEEPRSIFNVSYLIREISDLIDNSTQAETLFRTDSLITRHLTLFSMIHGMIYLERVLAPFISSILVFKKSLEISPSKVNLTQDSTNRRLSRLRLESSSILTSIFNSLEFLPVELCNIAECMFRKTKEKFPGFEHSICGGFLLLRFICPAIVSPESFGLCHPEPTDQIRRNLILVSKYIQYASNGNLVEDVNPMFPLNEALSTHIEQMKSFIESVAQRGSQFKV